MPTSVDEEVAALSRGADRDSLFMQANVTIDGKPGLATVRVRNLSAGGMLAESPVAVVQGATVEVELRNIGPVSGRVVWTGEKKFGIAFDRAINPQAVRRDVAPQKEEVPPTLADLRLNKGWPPIRPR
ncbi:PilZ domain-containing protein [Sphingopyxis sp. PET50]|uniref:PilZ domain-containing protein n=1 Tax=Sphingopyxis sp. PET50 TaxID=2976533 RepID=UPI0021AF2745|nr:PilZ domain-containing protein [Sphingopyxis sp. PET50]